jgi:hypothetical protein
MLGSPSVKPRFVSPLRLCPENEVDRASSLSTVCSLLSALPDRQHQLAAEFLLAGFLVGHDALVRAQDIDAESADDLRDFAVPDVDPLARFENPLQPIASSVLSTTRRNKRAEL